MTASWEAIGDLLTQSGENRGVLEVAPGDARRLSLIEAAAAADVASGPDQHQHGQRLGQRLAALVAQARTMRQIGNCPMVGITGLLNSGKSSLLAAYLSPAGRRRVLRGTANNQGTHRFVLWLPEVWWRQPDLLQVLRSYLTDLFGAAPEELSQEPSEAFAQYNGEILQRPQASNGPSGAATDPLRTPLIAHDAGLDPLGLALLDCPDIQTALGIRGSNRSGDGALDTAEAADADQAETMQQQRREQLGRVGRLCSAFVIVSKLSSLHDETLLAILDTLRDTMPGVRRILAVNKVKARYAPEIVDQQAQPLVQRFQIADVTMAYDFRSHWAEQRLPPVPAGMHVDPSDPLPIFFRAARTDPASAVQPRSARAEVSGEADQEEGSNVGLRPPAVAHYLQNLGQLLKPGSLVIEGRRSVLEQLEVKVAETLAWFESNQAQRQRQLQHVWQAIADACFAFMAQRDAADRAIGLRLQTSPAIIAQMSDSLVRAAPWSMRPSLAIDRSVRQLQSSIAGGVKRLRCLQSASSAAGEFLGRFRQGHTGKIVTADRFRDQLERCDRTGALPECTPEALSAACEHALTRFQKEDSVRLDDAWLDRWSAELWKHMPLKKKLYVGMFPLAPIFGPLLAVALLPFDGGHTAVLVFVSTKELLVAAGITALAVPTTLGGEVQDIVESETALTQLSELFAVTCDSLGVPRPAEEQLPKIHLAGQQRTLVASQLAVKPPAGRCALPMWRLAPHFASDLKATLQSLRSQTEENQNAP